MGKGKFLPGIISLVVVFFLSCDKENPVSHSECKDFNLKLTIQL
jgi:hypothetical protein